MSQRVITVAGFLTCFLEQHKNRPDHPFCFILGAGASVQSGIPAGSELAERWLKELHELRDFNSLSLEEWATADRLGIPGFCLNEVGSFYPELYEQRFNDLPENGYAFLEREMDGREPSFGYAALAYLMSETPHCIVITVNFDNLVADALSIHSRHFPLVIGHEALAGFASVSPRRPLVAKVHGALGFTPKNTRTETRELCDAWRLPLRGILSRYTPIVVGYGGNDGSLMGFLEELPEGVPENVYWMVWSKEKEPENIWNSTSARIQNFVEKKHGQIVPIPGFDEIMLLLYNRLVELLNYPDLYDRLRDRDTDREKRFDEQVKEITKRLYPVVSPVGASVVTPAVPKAAEAGGIAGLLKDAAAGLTARRRVKPWWKWVDEAEAAADSDQKQEIFRRALDELPKDAYLLANYAMFLANDRKDDAAEVMYKRALEAGPKNAVILATYADFLSDKHKDNDAAEVMYKRALEADSKNAFVLGSYADFLSDKRKNYDAAEAMYRRALEADPMDASVLRNYAIFLSGKRKNYDDAEAMFKRVLEADPKNAVILATYAVFLSDKRKNYDDAEAMYRRALEADPKDASVLGDYAVFLKNDRRDDATAEAMFKRGLEANPEDTTVLGNYAVFLSDVRKNQDDAEAMFKRGLEADPKDAFVLGSYAVFLSGKRKNYDAGEAMFKRALQANPEDTTVLGNYAVFLKDYRRDDVAAEAMCRRALEADPKDADNLGNYAGFLFGLGRSLEAMEYLKRAELVEGTSLALQVELLFYRATHDSDSWPGVLAQLKEVLEAGARSPGWSFEANIMRAEQDNHPNVTLLRVLAKVITEAADRSLLSEFAEWRDAGSSSSPLTPQ